MTSDPLTRLTELICSGIPWAGDTPRETLAALFDTEGLFHARHLARDAVLRDAYGLARTDDRDGGVPYAGLINPENPPSGPYGGTSLVWFPAEDSESLAGSLMSLVVGTRGLSPDEGLLTRAGHRPRVAALRRYLVQRDVAAWTKTDPAAISISVPKSEQQRLGAFEPVFRRYGDFLYCVAAVPRDPESARVVVQSFLSLYSHERGWEIRSGHKPHHDRFIADLQTSLFPVVTGAEVHSRLQERRFVVLQGPPGTGKTRLAGEILRDRFAGRGKTVQFHPSVTYEDFVVGLSPDPLAGSLRFSVRPGWLIQAIQAAKQRGDDYLLVIDEVNRADLGKVLGEAILLFEAGEVGGETGREVDLPHEVDGRRTLALPSNLYVLATMNTADRSIAGMDIAIRRRFAFMTMYPDRSVVAAQKLDLGTRYFDRLTDVFVEHAPEQALDLMPGHAYFLASNEASLRQRLRYELLPLLDEYLREGHLGQATAELHAVRDAIEDEVRR